MVIPHKTKQGKRDKCLSMNPCIPKYPKKIDHPIGKGTLYFRKEKVGSKDLSL